jgi:hypothetical protein
MRVSPFGPLEVLLSADTVVAMQGWNVVNRKRHLSIQ